MTDTVHIDCFFTLVPNQEFQSKNMKIYHTNNNYTLITIIIMIRNSEINKNLFIIW